MPTVEDLYKTFGILAEAKDKVGEHQEEYLRILEAARGGPNEKRLASQFIARFFRHFPDLATRALDAQIDLCEDDDVAIRKQAIKDLPKLCKDNVAHLPKIADVLAQLLQSEDATELGVVQASLMSLFEIDAKGTLRGLFNQVSTGEELVRERAIKFLATSVRHLSDDVLTPEVENTIVEAGKKVLEDVTGDEFLLLMTLFRNLKVMQTLLGRKQLLDIVTEQADLDKAFEAEDVECVDRLIQCVKQAMPLFSKNAHSTAFVSYMCAQVLPSLASVGVGGDGSDMQLELLKLLADMAAFAPDVTEPAVKLGAVYARLVEYLDLPPEAAAGAGGGENGENETPSEAERKLNFSYAECLMHTFHQLGSQHPEFLTANEERLKDFRVRLQYFAQGVQGYIKKLREALHGKAGEALKSDENKLKVLALKMTTNINTLIKDLFHNPPSYKNTITLSWKPTQRAAAAADVKLVATGTKRTPITFDSGDTPAKKSTTTVAKEDRKIYAPPSGKFSDKAGSYQPGVRGRGGFRGGRGGRGGGGRGWGGRGFKRW